MARNSNLLLLGAGAVAVYLLYSKASAAARAVAGAAGAAYGGAVTSVSDALSSFFGPSVTAPSTFYLVIFPDGTRNAVPSNTVDGQGNFTWTGYPAGSLPAQSYQIFVGSDGTKYALSNS